MSDLRCVESTIGTQPARASGGTDTNGIVYAMRIDVLVLDDAFDTGFSTMLDALEFANGLSESGPRFDARLVGVRKRVTTHRGLRVEVGPLRGADVVVVPALHAADPATMVAALRRRDVADACEALRASKGALVTAACTGT